ncbi:MAG: zf-TFIIB domain-containing protein [Myxococcota bacterium]
MALLCPRDGSALTPQAGVLGPNTSVHTCPKCAGVMVDWKQGQAFFQSLGLTVADLQSLVRQSMGRPQKSAPPACTSCGRGSMRPFTFKGVELDLCEACGASWLDRGELSRISGGKLGGDVKATGVAGETGKVVGIYEMLWDCPHCDAKELLGKTHRYCPNCGAPQDPAKRYFPPAGKETAASAQYDGADKSCPACQTPNGAKSHNCRHCGSPLDGAQEVGRVADRSTAAPKAGTPGQPAQAGKKRPWWIYALGGVAALCCVFSAVAVFWTKDVNVTVTGHSWQREIDVEQLQAVQDDAWCDSKPSDAYNVTSRREQRSTNKIPDGQECHTRDVDRGDGTFERRQECKTKFREEPVYDNRCYFTVDRWKKQRTEVAKGQGVVPEPHWPAVRLSRAGNSLGSEREGPRRETYSLTLEGNDGEGYSCTVPFQKWQNVADGTKKPIKVGVITGRAECDTL